MSRVEFKRKHTKGAMPNDALLEHVYFRLRIALSYRPNVSTTTTEAVDWIRCNFDCSVRIIQPEKFVWYQILPGLGRKFIRICALAHLTTVVHHMHNYWSSWNHKANRFGIDVNSWCSIVLRCNQLQNSILIYSTISFSTIGQPFRFRFWQNMHPLLHTRTRA